MTLLMKQNVVISRIQKTIISFASHGILLLAGCHGRKDNVELKLNHNNHSIVYTCSSIERKYSYLKRIFDVTGIGGYLKETKYTFHEIGALHAQYNNDGEIELWLYCNPLCYPILATISWVNKEGIRYTRALTLTDKDFDVHLAINHDIEKNPTYVYKIYLKANGTINVHKWQNFTLIGEKYSHDMQIKHYQE